jgi:hypothetical protein
MLLTMASKGHGATHSAPRSSASTSAASLRSELTTRLTSVPSRLPPLLLPPVDLTSRTVGTGRRFRGGGVAAIQGTAGMDSGYSP